MIVTEFFAMVDVDAVVASGLVCQFEFVKEIIFVNSDIFNVGTWYIGWTNRFQING